MYVRRPTALHWQDSLEVGLYSCAQSHVRKELIYPETFQCWKYAIFCQGTLFLSFILFMTIIRINTQCRERCYVPLFMTRINKAVKQMSALLRLIRTVRISVLAKVSEVFTVIFSIFMWMNHIKTQVGFEPRTSCPLATHLSHKNTPRSHYLDLKSLSNLYKCVDIFFISGPYNFIDLTRTSGISLQRTMAKCSHKLCKNQFARCLLSVLRFHVTWKTLESSKIFPEHPLPCIRVGMITAFECFSENQPFKLPTV